MTSNHYTEKIDGYMTEFKRHISYLRADARFGASDTQMRVEMSGENGTLSILMQFYRCTVRVMVVHSKTVDAPHEYHVRKRLKTFNSTTDASFKYDISDKTRMLTFSAGYDLRKRNAADDAGLYGFCQLLCQTVAVKLDGLAGQVVAMESDNESAMSQPFQPQRKRVLEVV